MPRPLRYFVAEIGNEWEVMLPRGLAHFPSRTEAVEAAKAAARDVWESERLASEVVISEDDGVWHLVVAYGSLLG